MILLFIYIIVLKLYFINFLQIVIVLDIVVIGIYVYIVSYSDFNVVDIFYIIIQKNNVLEFILNIVIGKVQLQRGIIIFKN